MKLLVRRKLDLHKHYLYLAALVATGIMVLQVANVQNVRTTSGILQYVVFFITNYGVWLLLLDYAYGVIVYFGQNSYKRKTEAVISFLLLILIHLALTNSIYYAYLVSIGKLSFNEIWLDFKPYILRSFLSRCADLVVLILLLKVIDSAAKVQKQKLQVVSLENKLHEAQLEALRSQLDPHFFFNTLHTLNTLIGFDDAKAKSMVMKVTVLMRTLLKSKDTPIISLSEELRYFKSYLDIEKERFHDRLEVELNIDKEALPFMVPTLILQPLLENAFKHGISRIEGKGIIRLKAKIIDSKLYVELSNSIPYKEVEELTYSTRVGLENLNHRLQLYFDDNYQFSTKKMKGLFYANLVLVKEISL